MKDTDWELIYELYQTSSITQVANKLFITQPALSKRINVIENEFQIKLVNRSSKGIKFTEEGTVLAKNAETFMDMMGRVKKQLREIKEKNEVLITIGVPYTFGRFVVEKLLVPYSNEHPNIHFEMVNGSSDRILSKALDGSVDLAFVRGDYQRDELVMTKVHTCNAYVMVKDKVELEDLPKMQRLCYKSNEKTQQLINRWWFERFNSQIPNGISGGDYLDMACNMAASGYGYVCCFVHEDYDTAHKLYKIPMEYLDGRPVTRNTWCCYKKSSILSPAVKSVLKYIENSPDFQV